MVTLATQGVAAFFGGLDGFKGKNLCHDDGSANSLSVYAIR